jgi:6-pyruvoyl tetrahydropterin synthase
MYEVTGEAAFSSGHYLRGCHGKCENPHGHNYRHNPRNHYQLKRRTRDSRPKALSKVMISLTPASKDISASR